MTAALYLPGATFRPISYRADAGYFAAPPLGYIVHVPQMNGSLFKLFDGLTKDSPGGRRFCTAWVAKDGSSEQYTELTRKSWAQVDGNGTYWSFEVEGFDTEPMTDAQIATLARWHNFLGVDNHIATAPGQPGIGTHYMGGAAWGGHSCPDPSPGGQGPRSHQRQQIITVATQGVDMPLDDTDKAWLTSALAKSATDAATQTWNRFTATNPAGVEVHLVDVLEVLMKDAAAQATSSGTPIDYAAIGTAVVNELASRGLTLQILGKA